MIDGFQDALDSAAMFDFGQGDQRRGHRLPGRGNAIIAGAQSAASSVSSTASTLFSPRSIRDRRLIQTPIDAVKAIYQGIKAAFAQFGIPLPFAATKPTAGAPAAAAVAAVAPAKAAAESEASSTTDEQTPAAPRASLRGTAGAAKRSLAPSTSAVAAQHDSPDSTSGRQSDTKSSDAKNGSDRGTGGSRASRHNAA